MHSTISNFDWFEYLKKYGSNLELEPIKKLLKLLGDPQTSFDSIHVTGTNGKGSTTAMTSSILRAAGYKTGMFTSPYLSRVTESIKVNGGEISIHDMEAIFSFIREKIQKLKSQGVRHPTQFEVLVALAYTYFSQENVDIAVIEVGMGGKNDATNIINSLASIITNISLEHTKWLGKNVEEIAETKAEILRKNTELITAANQRGVIVKLQEIANKRNSKLTIVDKDIKIIPETSSINEQTFTIMTPTNSYKNLIIPLIGSYQLRNAACAIAAIEAAKKAGFKITPEDIHRGLEAVDWPGRFEVMSQKPLIILDGAKDAEAIKALVETVKQIRQERRIISIIGISSDKTHHSMIHTLAEITDKFILTEHRNQNRTARASYLEKIAIKTGKPTEIIKPVIEAIKYAKKMTDPEDIILITGSVFLIGEAREYWYPA
jgi:dihydrofolate synthase/folylpolyglutamate synthase